VSSCRVRYNHYNEEFDLVDGKLDFEEVDEKYCISFVFKGNWTIKLQGPGNSELLPDGGALQKTVDDEGDPKVIGTFSGLVADAQYVIAVDEDPALADAPRKTYTATSGMQGRADFDDGEDLMLGVDKSSCSCLFGNPCASSYNCKDWNNRFDVAKKNGWKGFS